ncbi:MAG: hypothetical protein J6S78_05040 [Lachnospiraceae bacterium]|nr:hypothetical protein [Lachnospiraceae bacterium]
MLNMIRMELYRMVRMKSFWVILIIVGVMNVISVSLNDSITDDPQLQQAIEAASSEKDDPMANIGMSISMKRNDDGSYGFLEIITPAAKGMLCALFIGIFTVIFVTADFNTGYIKNYGGAVKHRWHMVAAKGTAVLVYTIMFFELFILSSSLGVYIGGHKLIMDPAGKIAEVLSVQCLLHIVFAWIIMSLCLIVRNNLISMIVSCCLSFHVFQALYILADKGLKKLGWEDAAISNYMVSGRIMKYGLESSKILGSTLLIAAIFAVVSYILGSLWVTKKDLV